MTWQEAKSDLLEDMLGLRTEVSGFLPTYDVPEPLRSLYRTRVREIEYAIQKTIDCLDDYERAPNTK